MEHKETLRILFFFNEMEDNAKEEIRQTGKLKPAVYALTTKSEGNRNCVGAAYIDSLMDKNGIEFVMAMMEFTHGMHNFIERVEREEETNVVAVFHREMAETEKGLKLFTMRKIKEGAEFTEGSIKMFNVINDSTAVGEDGTITMVNVEFVEETE
jgi:hypothetical protein